VRIEKISRNFEYELARLSAGALSPDNFDKLLSLFESEIKRVYFTESSEANLIRIIHGMLDKIFFINECIKYPHYVEILVVVSANSNYLTDILVVNPEYFYWIVNPSILKIHPGKNEFKKEIEKSISLYNSFTAKLHSLKTIKRRELLRIGLRDIYYKVPLQNITGELSVLASILSAELFELCLSEILKKYSISKISAHYCLISLGKLGGCELNYSSDIDLVLFYDKEKKIGNKKFISEILTETATLFLNSSSDINGGFLYRIDFRLRPDGRNAPICRSLLEYLNYYESRGENWERQMLIKAGWLCGNKSLYKKFTGYLTPFIYPAALSTSPKEQILKMKNDIEIKNNERENIKLLPGGIRDIEFAVQALQLLNGGRIKEIRTGNTLTAIELLLKSQLLDENEKLTLTGAYIFYRQIEHYLQLMNDRQTHVIPEAGELLEKMSFHMQFQSVKEFKQKISITRKEVRKIYNSILMDDETTNYKSNTLYEINFRDKIRANSDIQFLRDGKGITGDRTFDTKSIESFRNIEKDITNYLNKSSRPDITLSNFVRVIKQSGFPSIWYNELIDKTFFGYLMAICEYSQYSVDLFAEDKKLRDFLLSRKVFMKIPESELSNLEIRFIRFYFSVQITICLIDPVTASQSLSNVVKIKLKKIIDYYSNQTDWVKDYFVAALGSLGSSTLTFYSDFDIVFILRNTKNHPRIEKRFQELLAVIKSELNPFTIDCRLRPEGESSQLVWDIKSAKEYFRKRARVWEFQALTKINFIAGNKRLFNSFTKSAINSSTRFNKKEIKSEINAMRNKLTVKRASGIIDFFDFKKSPGSLNDIEFIVQYLIICDAELFNRSLGKTITETLKIKKGQIKKTDLKLLRDAIIFFKSSEILNQLIFNVSVSKIDIAGEKAVIISEKIMSGSIKHFNTLLKTYSSKVKNIYSQLLN
jgi:glutamate-ammonia-ligase adenylyltransferase